MKSFISQFLNYDFKFCIYAELPDLFAAEIQHNAEYLGWANKMDFKGSDHLPSMYT